MVGSPHRTGGLVYLHLGSLRDLRHRRQAGGATLVGPRVSRERAAERRGGILPAFFAGGSRSGLAANLVLIAAAGTIAVSAAVHLHLWNTIAGFLMPVHVGLLNFRDSWSATFAGMAFAYEIESLVLLAAGSTLCVMRRSESRYVVASSSEQTWRFGGS
jgi:hypothetical protein